MSTVASSPTPGRAAPVADAPRAGRLALAFQEAFTVTVRLRSGVQVATDAGSFRTRMKQLLAAADREARGAGYDGEIVRLAVYAFVAFLDESVLNSDQPMFADWARQPLQEEVFGDHMAGETFFSHLRDLLTRQGSSDLADLLEVYELCILLGFRGRYGSGGSGEIRSLVESAREKVRRIRGDDGTLSRRGEPPPDESVPRRRDPWLRRLVWTAAGLAVLAVVLFVAYSLLLGSGVEAAEEIAERIVR